MRADDVVQRPWTKDEDAILKRMWADPASSCAKIGAVLGRSKNSVISRARRVCDTARGERPTIVYLTEAQVLEMERLAPSGLGIRGIARVLRVDPATVLRAARRHEIIIAPYERHLHPATPPRKRPASSYSAAEREAHRAMSMAVAKTRARDDEPLRIGPLPLPDHQDPKPGTCKNIFDSGPRWRYCGAPEDRLNSDWCVRCRAVVYRAEAVMKEAA